jgi:tRNA (guanine-N7-)-methyltransferase
MRAQIPSPPPQEFGIVPDPAYLRQYPHAHHARLPISFYPAQPERIAGDVLEIGPGRGDFLLSTAEAHPELRFVAVELGKKRHPKLIQRAQKRGLTNLLFIHGDARLVLPRFFEAETFGAAVVLFPDPWPKRRHAFNRLLQPEFLVELARVLRPGGHLYLKSDVESYIGWVEEQVAHLPHFRIVEDNWPWEPVHAEEDGKTLSLFAERQTSLGYGIHSLCLERSA